MIHKKKLSEGFESPGQDGEARVCTRVFSTIMSWSNEDES